MGAGAAGGSGNGILTAAGANCARGEKNAYAAEERHLLGLRYNGWVSGYDADGTEHTSIGELSGRVPQNYAQSVVRAVEILSSPTAVPTMSPPVLESPVPTSTPLLPALLPATGREPHGEAADTLLALPVVALVVGFALLLGRRYAK